MLDFEAELSRKNADGKTAVFTFGFSRMGESGDVLMTKTEKSSTGIETTGLVQ